MPRFLEAAGENGKQQFKQALAFEFGARGIPLLYYGAEDGMGARPGDCRADKRHGEDPEMRAFVEELTALRQSSVALRRGEQKELYYDDDTYAFARVHPDQTMVVAANFDHKTHRRQIPLPQADVQLLDRLSGKVYHTRGEVLEVDLPAHGTLMLEIVGKADPAAAPAEKSWRDWLPF